jgi:hypothetical protein
MSIPPLTSQVKDRLLSDLNERKIVKTISLKKVSAVAVASLGFGLLSVVPAQAAAATFAAIPANTTTVRTDDATYKDTYSVVTGGRLAAYNTSATGTGTEFGLKATFSGVNTGIGSKVKVGYQENATATEVLISTVAGQTAEITATEADVVKLGTSVYLGYSNTTSGRSYLGTPSSGVYTIGGTTANSGSSPFVTLILGRNAAPGLYTLYVAIIRNIVNTSWVVKRLEYSRRLALNLQFCKMASVKKIVVFPTPPNILIAIPIYLCEIFFGEHNNTTKISLIWKTIVELTRSNCKMCWIWFV